MLSNDKVLLTRQLHLRLYYDQLSLESVLSCSLCLFPSLENQQKQGQKGSLLVGWGSYCYSTIKKLLKMQSSEGSSLEYKKVSQARITYSVV